MSLDFFASPGVISVATELLEKAHNTLANAYPSHDPKIIRQFVTAHFDLLQRTNQVPTTEAIVAKYRSTVL